MYNAYVRSNKRMLKAEVGIPLERAIDFLNETKNGVIMDTDNREYTKEELEYVKSVGSLPGFGEDNPLAGGGEISEDPNRELFSFIRDHAESSSERDN